MNAYRHKSNSIKKYILASVVVLGLFGCGYYWYVSQEYPQDNTSSDAIDFEGPSKEVIEAGNDAKANTVKKDQEAQSEKTPRNSTTTENMSDDSASYTVNVTTAVDDAKNLRVNSIISGIHSQGTCKLTLTKGSQVITKSSGVQPLTDYTACTGFDAKLTSGAWVVTLKVTIDGKSVTKSTTVEVS